MNCDLNISGDNCFVQIGANNTFNNSILVIEDNGSKIIIGDNNRFSGQVHMGIVEGTTLTIKNCCLFSSGIYITTTDSHSLIDISTGKRINPSKNVTIGNHVWIGQKVTIGKGVEIADDVMIGGSSFVSKSIMESHSVAAGIPAKIIKRDITWDIKRI